MSSIAEEARTYENAVKILEARQRRIRPEVQHASRNPPSSNHTPRDSGMPDLRGTPGIAGMKEWLLLLGHTVESINALNVIHIAGTKGKGSTCAFIESFLRAHGQRVGFPSKTGMYTSPHLILPEERIRINSHPLTPGMFARYFFEVYERLPQLALEYDPAKELVERGPRSLQLYALFAFHVFIRENVDVAVVETHSGGEYDATNVVTKPIVTAVTSLGMDHVQMLGPSIENIAWHKGGIYKSGAIALSTTQDAEPGRVLVHRASDVGEGLTFVKENPKLPAEAAKLSPVVQRKNASLAVAAVNAFLARTTSASEQSLSEEDLRRGVEQWHWPGRFDILSDRNRTWYLDAAHNEMSVQIAAEWFVANSAGAKPPTNRILIFSHINELRNAVGVLRSLAEELRGLHTLVDHVIFTTYALSDQGCSSRLTEDLMQFRDTWAQFFPSCRSWYESTIKSAISRACTISAPKGAAGTKLQPQGSGNQASERNDLFEVCPESHILITGSQHLVGPALRILQAGG